MNKWRDLIDSLSPIIISVKYDETLKYIYYTLQKNFPILNEESGFTKNDCDEYVVINDGNKSLTAALRKMENIAIARWMKKGLYRENGWRYTY